MTKEEFINHYVINFLSSYMAVTYTENCQRGWPDRSQPVEDAECLAEQAWEQLENLVEVTLDNPKIIWQFVKDKTTTSGKVLFRCSLCGYETPAPIKSHQCTEEIVITP